MIRDITIGQYYASDSVIHRLDPRVKIMVTLVYIISLFLFDDFMGYAVAVGFFFLAVSKNLFLQVPSRSAVHPASFLS